MEVQKAHGKAGSGPRYYRHRGGSASVCLRDLHSLCPHRGLHSSVGLCTSWAVLPGASLAPSGPGVARVKRWVMYFLPNSSANQALHQCAEHGVQMHLVVAHRGLQGGTSQLQGDFDPTTSPLPLLRILHCGQIHININWPLTVSGSRTPSRSLPPNPELIPCCRIEIVPTNYTPPPIPLSVPLNFSSRRDQIVSVPLCAPGVLDHARPFGRGGM